MQRTVRLTRPSQLKAMAHPARTAILSNLEDQPMSAKRLAALLDMTHGKVGHHLTVLEREGLIEPVEERRARGFVERFFGLTYDRLIIEVPGAEHDRLSFLFAQAAREAAPAAIQPFDPFGRLYSIRVPESVAAEFAARLVALADDFASHDGQEGERFGFAGAVYRVRRGGST